jgi:hypothetical protein
MYKLDSEYQSFINIKKKLKDYENLLSKDYNIYENINILIDKNPNILTDDNILIYLINWPCGFGSALTVYMSNQYYFNIINNKIICLPYFCINTHVFRYHDINYNNSFFLYFKYKNDINLNNKKIYFLKSNVIDPFVISEIIPPMNNVINKNYIELFNNNFILIPNNNCIKYIKNIKNKTNNLIGLHLRSRAQKAAHYPELKNFDLIKTLTKYKNKFDIEYNNDYKLFIASDINIYIDSAKDIFSEIYFLEDVVRIDSENDSVPLLSEYEGYKLGSDILNECYCLSMCDKIYISYTNISFIISIINPHVDMELLEYN